MTPENKQLISELLTLKAGMSLVAIEAEKISNAEADYKEKAQLHKWSISNLDSEKARIKSKKELAEKQDAEMKEYRNEQSKKKNIGIIGIISGLVLIAIGCVKLLNLLSGNVDDIDFTPAILMLGGASAFIFGLNVLFPGRYKTPVAPKIHDKLEFDQNKEAYKANLKRLMADKEKAEAVYNKAKATYEKVYSESYPVAKILFESLLVSYNETLRARDWKYVDLVIHYLDSERADNKKEALLLVDKQVQNDDIVRAINNATAEICGTIRTVGDLIRYDMDRHFSNLSTQIARQHESLIDSIGSLGGNIATTNERLSQINNSQNMQNVLLAKISTNSSKLAESVDYIERHTRVSY